MSNITQKNQIIQKADICPICGAHALKYEGPDILDNQVAFPWECDNCHTTGEEIHDLIFNHHTNIKTINEKE